MVDAKIDNNRRIVRVQVVSQHNKGTCRYSGHPYSGSSAPAADLGQRDGLTSIPPAQPHHVPGNEGLEMADWLEWVEVVDARRLLALHPL